MPELARLRGINRRTDQRGGGLNAAQVVGGEFENCNVKTGQVLLIAHVLVRSNEKLELAFRPTKQFSMLDSAPTTFLGRSTLVTGEEFVHRSGNALVQQDSHAAVGISSAVSERSKMWRAISHVTEGKHSRNSSSE
jgi:hypothetical protein